MGTLDSAYAWKRFYADERERLGSGFVDAALDSVDGATPADAWVVPHTRAEVTAHQYASVATAVVASGCDRVLMLGVLHGARREDAALVDAARRRRDPAAIARLRGVHTDDGLASEEFSLDAFTVFVERAAARVGRTVGIVRRYPFLVGRDPVDLPGLAELEALHTGGAALVATADPIHHGRAYATPAEECLDTSSADTRARARAAVEAQLDALSAHDFVEFAALTAQHQSDFRDAGPVLAHLLGPGFTATIDDLALVDYATALDAAPPSWVAGAQVRLMTRRSSASVGARVDAPPSR